MKLKSFPKQPKSKNLATWQKYEQQVIGVVKHNQAIISDKKKVEDLKKKIAGLKSKGKTGGK